MKSLFTRSSVCSALALAAMVATTTFAHANSLTVATSGQIAIGSPTASTPGVITNVVGPPSFTYTNTTCANTTMCGGSSGLAVGSTGYNFGYTNWTAFTSTTGSPGVSGNVGFVGGSGQYDPACGSACSVLALEADNYGRSAVDLTLGGLVSGDVYTLHFDWDEDQQSEATCGGVNGPCSGNYEANLTVNNVGGATVSDTYMDDVVAGVPQAQMDQTFTQPWSDESITFTASGTTEELAFLATSNLTSQVPAFALVDDVTLTGGPPTVTPEPNSLLLLSTGLLGLGGFLRMRLKKAATKA